MALLMTNYNFVRPHTALRFGKTVKTPAMQAGLAKKKLSFWDVFMSQAVFLLFILIAIRLQTTAECRHQQQLPEEAPRVATFSLTTPAKAPSMFSTSIQTRSLPSVSGDQVMSRLIELEAMIQLIGFKPLCQGSRALELALPARHSPGIWVTYFD